MNEPETNPSKAKHPNSLTPEEAEGILQRMAQAQHPATPAQLSSRAQLADENGAAEAETVPILPPPGGAAPREWDQQTLHAMLESVPDAVVVVAPDGAMVLVNRKTEELFGFARSELLGWPVELLIPERLRAKHVRHRDGYLANPHVRPMGAGLDLYGRRKNGSEFPVEISLSPVQTVDTLMVMGTIRDITERRRAELQLRNAEARYRTLVEGIPAVTFMAALDETAADISSVYVSPQIESLLGFTQKEWLEDPVLWYRQLHPDDRERWHLEFARTCATAEAFDSVYRFMARDGRIVWVNGHATVVRDGDGRPIFLQGIAFDITQRKQAEQAMTRLNETLERRVAEAVAEAEDRARQLTQSNEALDRFAYITSHDLREPLRTIMRYMQLLQRMEKDQFAESAEQYVAKTIDGARQMNQLISDLHTHSRIGRRGEFSDVDCAAVLTEACAHLRAALEDSGASVKAGELPVVRAVNAELLLLFQNLIQNAVKFCNERKPEIRVSAQREGDGWLFRFEDNGIGIEPQYLERIFGLGERLHGRTVPGTGFGLANCRKIVEHHGGEIWAESTPGTGSTFCFRLPQKPPSDVSSPAAAERDSSL